MSFNSASLSFQDGEFLYVKPSTKTEQMIVNGVQRKPQASRSPSYLLQWQAGIDLVMQNSQDKCSYHGTTLRLKTLSAST